MRGWVEEYWYAGVIGCIVLAIMLWLILALAEANAACQSVGWHGGTARLGSGMCITYEGGSEIRRPLALIEADQKRGQE